jgi:hypothetical protein
MSPHRDRQKSKDDVQAPHDIFGSDNSEDQIAPPPPVQINALQDMLKERQKNWTEMTPAQIPGVPEADQPADASSLDVRRREPDLSPLETFLRQQRLARTGTTNLPPGNEHLSFLDDRTGLPNELRLEEMRNGFIAHSAIFDRLLENAGGISGLAGQEDSDGAWAKVFVAPRQNQPNSQQVADMEAFVRLLQPAEPSADSKSPAAGLNYLSPVKPLTDPNVEPPRPGYNPAGASFQPLESGIGRPKRLPGLPTITSGLAVPSAPTLAPGAPQPPPWMSDTPQLFVNPVRRY